MLPQAKVIHFLLERVFLQGEFFFLESEFGVNRKGTDSQAKHKEIVVAVCPLPQIPARIADAVDTIFQSNNIFFQDSSLPEPFLFYFLPGFRQILPVSAAPLLFFLRRFFFSKDFVRIGHITVPKSMAYGHYQRGHGADEASSRTQNIV